MVMKSIIFWDITPYNPFRSTDVSGEHIASIFRVEEISSGRNQQASGCCCCLDKSQEITEEDHKLTQ
jgi:hypothetical protein